MALSLCFTACSDDDEPVIDGGEGNEEVVVKELLGDYIGVKNVITMGGKEYTPKFHHVAQLQKGKEGDEYALTLPYDIDKQEKSLNDSRHGQMPKLILDDIELTKNEDGTYTYSDDEEIVGSGDSEVKIMNLSVTVKGTSIKIDWKAQPKGMSVTLTYSFEGDKNEKIVPMPEYAGELIKSYKGMHLMNVGGKDSEPVASTSTIFGQNNGKFTFRLPMADVKAEGMTMPLIDIKDVEFTEGKDKTYSFSLDKLDYNTGSYVAKLSNLKVTLKGGDMDLQFTMVPGGMPMPIVSKFSTKPVEKPSVDVTAIAATYYGDNMMKVGETVMPAKNQIATIEAQENGKISLILPENNKDQQGKAGMGMPSIKLEDLEVTLTGDTYTFVISEKKFTVQGMDFELKDLKAEVKGNILKLDYKLMPVKMQMFIENSFVGDKTGYHVPEITVDAHKIEGTYVGDNKMIVAGKPSVMPNTAIKVTATDNNTIQLFIPSGEKARAMSMPDITLDNVKVTGSEDGTYSFTLAEKVLELGTMTITLKDVKGTVKEDKMDITYVAQPTGMPMPINFVYSGVKKEESVDPDATADKILPGKYVGMDTTTMGGSLSRAEEDDIHKAFMNVTLQENGKFTIQLPEQILAEGEEAPSMSLPTILVKDLEAVKGEDGNFTITLNKTEFEMGEAKKVVKIADLKAIFTTAGEASFTAKTQYGGMPLSIGFDFKGKKEVK